MRRAPRLLAWCTQIQAGLDADERDKTLLERVAIAIRAAEADDPDGSITDHDYAEAFRGRARFRQPGKGEAGAKIKARPPSVALALATALDDWANICRTKRVTGVKGNLIAGRPRRRPRPCRNEELRDRLLNGFIYLDLQQQTLQALARTAKFEELGPISLHLLGSALTPRSGDHGWPSRCFAEPSSSIPVPSGPATSWARCRNRRP